MAGVARRICASTVLLAVVSIMCQVAYADTQGGRLVPWRIERDIRRFKTVATDNVMNLLAIRPGMTILDIGAGTGQFAYEFAGKLKGTGRVYATDINRECIEYIKKEADRRGLGNLHPVLVMKDGIDGFYGKRKYDLITVFHLSSMTYEEQVDYFRVLRGFLAEDGRLVLILYKIPTLFSPNDFTGDFPGLIRELSMEPPESPFYRVLKESTKIRIRNHPEAEPLEEWKSAVAGDFNETLSDAGFAGRFSSGSVFRKEVNFSPEERDYADWLLVPYEDRGGVRRENNSRSASGTGRFPAINKLLIVQRYRKYLKRDGMFVPGFTPSIRTVFEQAGYRLEREYGNLIPFEDMVVFSSP